ncbi:hypothetical protein LBMAG48_17260 [Phycisphaerae bacterium]|nr:hypothetical protein LBMAG48_17260 [Phycisphaerae bacterium]
MDFAIFAPEREFDVDTFAAEFDFAAQHERAAAIVILILVVARAMILVARARGFAAAVGGVQTCAIIQVCDGSGVTMSMGAACEGQERSDTKGRASGFEPEHNENPVNACALHGARRAFVT